jgi:transketolase
VYLYSEHELARIGLTANQIRLHVLDMVFGAQTGHIGGAFSVAEILAALYDRAMRYDVRNPHAENRDRLIFSKGHACAALYSVLAQRGFFDAALLSTFRKIDSTLQGHPDPHKTPGVEVAAGPLGHGVAIAAGLGLGLRGNGVGVDPDKPSSLSAPSTAASLARVFVILGDGELDAGVVWEGAMVASKYRLGNICVIVDLNGVTQTGATADTMPVDRLAERWSSFGWHVQEIHGHNVAEILGAVDRAADVHAQPSVILARTTKGKGVSFTEYDHRWHGSSPSQEQYEQARQELLEVRRRLEQLGGVA